MKNIVSVIFIFIFYISNAQLGGRATYQFLNIITSPKIAALGGNAIAIPDSDLEMTYFNPALLNEEHNKSLSINYTDYFGDINYGYAAYALKYKKLGMFSAGIKYINYGTFLNTDEAGIILGQFTASESALVLSWANKYLEYFKYGVNLKLVYSNFYTYNSTGILLDFGATFKKPKSNFMAAVSVRNLGTQIKTYSPDNFEPLPFEILVGVSQRLKHAPFRFSINAHNLQQANIWYKSPNNTSTGNLFTTDTTEEKSHLGDAILRHFTFGTEILLSENFQLRVGYNHQRRQELKLKEDSKSGMVGFSFGFGIKIKKFQFDFARSIYSLAGASNHIGITTKLSDFVKKEAEKSKETNE